MPSRNTLDLAFNKILECYFRHLYLTFAICDSFSPPSSLLSFSGFTGSPSGFPAQIAPFPAHE